MRKTYRALSLALVAAAVPVAVSAQTAAARPFNLGAQANFETEGSNFGIGVRYENSLNRLVQNLPLRAAASFDYFFIDNVTYFEINANVLYSFTMANSPVTPYAGGGLNYARMSVDFGPPIGSQSNSDVGLNLVGGVQFRSMGSLKPFVEGRFELGGGENFIITAGLLFF